MAHIASTPNRAEYHLLSFDSDGLERLEDGHLYSDHLSTLLRSGEYTDILIASHGWNNDVGAALVSYDRWIDAMSSCAADISAAQSLPGGFKPLIVAIHWPSLAWGREELPRHSFEAGGNAVSLADSYAERIASTPAAREALAALLEAAEDDLEPETLPPKAVLAYRTLYAEAGLIANGANGPPGTDHDEFDPGEIYQQCREAMEQVEDLATFDFGEPIAAGLLAPLRILSFWKMKQRGCTIGERGAANLLAKLQADVNKTTRFHVMGHSFGCIVTSAMIARAPQWRESSKVNSLILIQGALSTWSYSDQIPRLGLPGYFRTLIEGKQVQGPLIAIHSRYDLACRIFYPIGAYFGPQRFAPENEPTRYGALGTFGVQGSGLTTEPIAVKSMNSSYALAPGAVYNLDGQNYIKAMQGIIGAHNDIAHPEIAHAFWAAVLTSDGS